MTEDEIEASLRAFGFLSPALSELSNAYRHEEAELHAVADALNSIGQRQIHRGCDAGIQVGTLSALNITTRLLIRTMSGFQGSVLLIGRGMTVEARTLIRGCYENAFWIGYFHSDPEGASNAFLVDEERSQIGRRAVILRVTRAAGDQSTRDHFERALGADPPKPKGEILGLEELSRRANMHAQYVFHRHLSAELAHPSLNSLDRYLATDENGDWTGFILGPDNDGIHDALSLACHALITALVVFGEIIGVTDDDAELAGVYAKYRRAVGIEES